MTTDELIADLNTRKKELEAEMLRVQQLAASQAADPYRAALGEIERVLALLQPLASD
jgi:hypothetical protein